ncbi:MULTISPECIES: redox-sensing transcriptional repressor Rex [unclassified Frankia]
MSQPRRRPAVIRRRTRSDAASRRSSEVPEATVARLPLYLRVLATLAESGVHTVSSDTLAAAAGVTPAKVRKDLSHLGSYGTRGVGYEVDVLLDCIAAKLGLTEDRAVVLVGVGNLGHALAGYGGFYARGFRIVALVDADPERVGERVGEVVVSPVDDLEQVIVQGQVTIGMICTPAAAAQGVCDRLVAAGVTSILNFAPTVLSVPDGVDVRKVDLAVELQILSFHEARKHPSPARDTSPRRGARSTPGAGSGRDAVPVRRARSARRAPSAREAVPGGDDVLAARGVTGLDGVTSADGTEPSADRLETDADEVVRVTRQVGVTRPAGAARPAGMARDGRPTRDDREGEPGAARLEHTPAPGSPTHRTLPAAGSLMAGGEAS